jgi:opacity protein-like surface antigen
MKKHSALLTLALVGALQLHAQDTKKFRLGLELCPNLGWVSSEVTDYKSDGTGLGFRFGLLGDVQLGSNANYFFSTGVFLNNLKAKSVQSFTVTDSTGSRTTTFNGETKLQYVEIPLTIKLKTNEIGYLTYFGQIGFDAGFRTSAKAKLGDGDFVDFSDNANILRLALSVGGGVEYNFSGNTSALLGVRYSNAFTSVNDGDGAKAKLHYFEITVGALF